MPQKTLPINISRDDGPSRRNRLPVGRVEHSFDMGSLSNVIQGIMNQSRPINSNNGSAIITPIPEVTEETSSFVVPIPERTEEVGTERTEETSSIMIPIPERTEETGTLSGIEEWIISFIENPRRAFSQINIFKVVINVIIVVITGGIIFAVYRCISNRSRQSDNPVDGPIINNLPDTEKNSHLYKTGEPLQPNNLVDYTIMSSVPAQEIDIILIMENVGQYSNSKHFDEINVEKYIQVIAYKIFLSNIEENNSSSERVKRGLPIETKPRVKPSDEDNQKNDSVIKISMFGDACDPKLPSEFFSTENFALMLEQIGKTLRDPITEMALQVQRVHSSLSGRGCTTSEEKEQLRSITKKINNIFMPFIYLLPESQGFFFK